MLASNLSCSSMPLFALTIDHIAFMIQLFNCLVIPIIGSEGEKSIQYALSLEMLNGTWKILFVPNFEQPWEIHA